MLIVRSVLTLSLLASVAYSVVALAAPKDSTRIVARYLVSNSPVAPEAKSAAVEKIAQILGAQFKGAPLNPQQVLAAVNKDEATKNSIDFITGGVDQNAYLGTGNWDCTEEENDPTISKEEC